VLVSLKFELEIRKKGKNESDCSVNVSYHALSFSWYRKIFNWRSIWIAF